MMLTCKRPRVYLAGGPSDDIDVVAALGDHQQRVWIVDDDRHAHTLDGRHREHLDVLHARVDLIELNPALLELAAMTVEYRIQYRPRSSGGTWHGHQVLASQNAAEAARDHHDRTDSKHEYRIVPRIVTDTGSCGIPIENHPGDED